MPAQQPQPTPRPPPPVDSSPFGTTTVTTFSTVVTSMVVASGSSLVPNGISNNPAVTQSPTPQLFTHTTGDGDDNDNEPANVDSTAVIIGAVVAAIVCVLCVVLLLALLYRKRVKDQEIDAAIASHTATNSHFESFSLQNQSAGPHVNNSMYQPNPFSTQAFDSAAAVAGAFQCPMCSNCYPSEKDVMIHVQKRHQESASSGYSTAQWSTAEFTSPVGRPMVTYDSEMPVDAVNYRAYDIPSQPSHLYVVAPPTESERHTGGTVSHEPANYRGLQPYSTMGEERFAKFQS
jgi:hypothetical protein